MSLYQQMVEMFGENFMESISERHRLIFEKRNYFLSFSPEVNWDGVYPALSDENDDWKEIEHPLILTEEEVEFLCEDELELSYYWKRLDRWGLFVFDSELTSGTIDYIQHWMREYIQTKNVLFKRLVKTFFYHKNMTATPQTEEGAVLQCLFGGSPVDNIVCIKHPRTIHQYIEWISNIDILDEFKSEIFQNGENFSPDVKRTILDRFYDSYCPAFWRRGNRDKVIEVAKYIHKVLNVEMKIDYRGIPTPYREVLNIHSNDNFPVMRRIYL